MPVEVSIQSASPMVLCPVETVTSVVLGDMVVVQVTVEAFV